MNTVLEEFDLRKSLGKHRADPFDKFDRRKFVWKNPHSRRTKQNSGKTPFRAGERDNLARAAREEEMHGSRRKYFHARYYNDIYESARSPLQEAQRKKSGHFCKVCNFAFCDHKAAESAMLIFHSWNCADGAFAHFPKDIALLLANEVYRAQLDFLASSVITNRWGFVMNQTPCADTTFGDGNFRKITNHPSRRPKG